MIRDMKPEEIADEAIGLFLEYRDQHGHSEASARSQAIREVIDAQVELEDISAQREGYIRVTAEDLGSHPIPPSTVEIKDDYVLVCAGSCHIASRNDYPRSGTVQLTIKGRKA